MKIEMKETHKSKQIAIVAEGNVYTVIDDVKSIDVQNVHDGEEMLYYSILDIKTDFSNNSFYCFEVKESEELRLTILTDHKTKIMLEFYDCDILPCFIKIESFHNE